jgi:solute carrier family 25 protein 44
MVKLFFCLRYYSIVVAQAIGGGSAGIITAVATNPMDMVRTRTQIYTEYGAIDTIKYIIDRNGLRGLMTGVSAVSLSK